MRFVRVLLGLQHNTFSGSLCDPRRDKSRPLVRRKLVSPFSARCADGLPPQKALSDQSLRALRQKAREAFRDIILEEMMPAERERVDQCPTVGYSTLVRCRPRLDTFMMVMWRRLITEQQVDQSFFYTYWLRRTLVHRFAWCFAP